MKQIPSQSDIKDIAMINAMLENEKKKSPSSLGKQTKSPKPPTGHKSIFSQKLNKNFMASNTELPEIEIKVGKKVP